MTLSQISLARVSIQIGVRASAATIFKWAQEDAAKKAPKKGIPDYTCKEGDTLGCVEGGSNQFWLMMGDFNSPSPLDSYAHHIPEGDPRLWTQGYILEHTPYIDIIAYRHPKEYFSTSMGGRIDFVYATRTAYDCVSEARVIGDSYTTQVRDAQGLGNFYHPSDHLPILVDFRLK